MIDPNLTQRLVRGLRVTERRLQRGTRILPQMLADRVVIVLQGALAMESGHGRADAQILEVISPVNGVICGRSLMHAEHSLSLVALVPTRVIRMAEPEFAQHAAADSALASALLMASCERSKELLQRLVAREQADVQQRVAGALEYLADKVGADCPLAQGCQVQLAQSNVAATAGLSRQTTNRALQELQSSGFVRIERSMVCLLDRDATAMIASGRTPAYTHAPPGPCRQRHPEVPLTCIARRAPDSYSRHSLAIR